ncbi:MAG: hypothetical protein RL254_1841, partial [Planctomycetota bacterium]
MIAATILISLAFMSSGATAVTSAAMVPQTSSATQSTTPAVPAVDAKPAIT